MSFSFRHFLIRRRYGLSTHAVMVLTIAAVLGGIATYATLTANPSLEGGNARTVTWLLIADLVTLLLLGAVIARRLLGIWFERRQGLAGSRLHVRLITVFGLLAITPAILVAVFSAFFFYIGVQSWFSTQVKTAISQAQNVAQAYLEEHKQVLRSDILAMASDLNREDLRLSYDTGRFNQIVGTQALLREFNEVLVFDGRGKILSRAGYTFSMQLDSIPQPTLDRVRRGEVVLTVDEEGTRVRALIHLGNLGDVFLFAGRFVDQKVLNYIKDTNQAAQAYAALEGQRSALQVTITLIYIVVALLLLLVAIWYGLNYATQLVKPVSALIAAADRVRSGDLTAQVKESGTGDELDTLSRAFNRMMSQLEAVLEGVSAGVISLDQEGRIILLNASAAMLLDFEDIGVLRGRRLTDVVPEMADLILSIQRYPGRAAAGQIQVKHKGGSVHTLLVRIAADQVEGETKGYVVTFDDVSELLSAQRKAAWADVARRIAHEIKNPLTPIQLSAERLRRKYGKDIVQEPQVFQECVNTIIRQVDDIRRMVDEFSAFARMPRPVMKPENMVELCKQAVFLQRTANPSISFQTFFPASAVTRVCDGRLVSQALTNLLQNAIEAIDGRVSSTVSAQPPGEIILRLVEKGNSLVLSVEDNGKGLPHELRDRLTEPYVTTREKGTGLGLAIVKKIMEDHGGTLRLEDRPGGGAIVSLIFPDSESDKKENI